MLHDARGDTITVGCAVVVVQVGLRYDYGGPCSGAGRALGSDRLWQCMCYMSKGVLEQCCCCWTLTRLLLPAALQCVCVLLAQAAACQGAGVCVPGGHGCGQGPLPCRRGRRDGSDATTGGCTHG